MGLQSTLPHKSSHATGGADALSPAAIGAATAAQGAKADSALQPFAVDYAGEYNNGIGYGPDAVVLWNGALYKKISNFSNPGYAPNGADWELFEPEIGSPAYDLWAQTALAGKAELVHEHFQPDPEYAADSVANAQASRFDGQPSTIFLRESTNVYRGTSTAGNPQGSEYSIFLDDGLFGLAGLWVLMKQDGELVSMSTNATTYPWEATWEATEWPPVPAPIVQKAALPRLRGTPLAATASEGSSAYAARQDHVHPLPTPADIGAAAEDHSHPLPTPADIGAAVEIDTLGLATDSYVIAKGGDDLIAKYIQAAALNPNGSEKSATNRASLILMPGNYTFSQYYTFNVEFVDIIGLGSQTKKPSVIIQGTFDVEGDTYYHFTFNANDIRVSGLSFLEQAFYNGDNKPLQIFQNCTGGDACFGDFVNLSGTFIDCVGGDYAFGSGGGNASGTFTNCIAGAQSFGGSDGIASGIFIDCTGGTDCFGGNGAIASGKFTNCTGGLDSFGGEGTTSGTFVNCTLTVGTFNALSIPASGTAIMINCIDASGNIINGQNPL